MQSNVASANGIDINFILEITNMTAANQTALISAIKTYAPQVTLPSKTVGNK
jgi:hypothetical protein